MMHIYKAVSLDPAFRLNLLDHLSKERRLDGELLGVDGAVQKSIISTLGVYGPYSLSFSVLQAWWHPVTR